MQRFSKDNIIAQIRDSGNIEELLTYQCVEYTERNRRACITELSSFLEEQSERLFPEKVEEPSTTEELVVGQGEDAQTLLHPALDAILLLSGTPYKWHALKPWQKAWAWFMMGTIYACLIACFCRTIVMR